MDRRLLYIGIALLVAGIAAAAMSSNSMSLSSFGTPVYKSLSLAPNSTEAVPMALNQTGIVSVSYRSANAIGFVLANASAYGSLPGGTSGLLQGAAALEGSGVVEIVDSASYGSYPSEDSLNVTYVSNSLGLGAGTYYAIFSNPGGSSDDVWVAYIAVPMGRITSAAFATSGYGLASVLLFLAGIILLILSFLRGGAPKPSAAVAAVAIDAEAERMYDAIERKGPRPRRASAGNRKKGARK